MDDLTIIRECGRAVFRGDVGTVRDLTRRHPEAVEQKTLDYWLRIAARRDDVGMVAFLVNELEADINAPRGDRSPEGAIDDAAGSGAINVVRWLLDRGAKINHEVEGDVRCFALTSAACEGHLEVVKLLLEHGADINAIWIDQNALSMAIMYGQKEVEAYLRSKGALEPWQILGTPPPSATYGVLQHIESHFGKPESLSARQIVAGSPPVAIHVVHCIDRLVLATEGMSDLPMTVPEGGEAFRFAELLMYLPSEWPLRDRDPNHIWPIEWLLKIARYPHENRTWLGGPATVIANGEPPKPLAPNTELTCLLLLTQSSEAGWAELADGRRVAFYTMYPIYTEERDLERERGTAALVQLFQDHGISRIVDVQRPNVARLSGATS